MDGRAVLMRRAFLRMLPALLFAIVFVGGGCTLLALEDHSWWKPLIFIVAVPLVSGYMARAWRQRRLNPSDQSHDGWLDAGGAAIGEEQS